MGSQHLDTLQEMRQSHVAMTVEDLQAAVDQLPDDIRARLAKGPIPRRWDCGVCVAFGRPFWVGEPDPTDPRWIAWDYHEVPKLEMKRANQQWYGELANDTYERCIATYRAAGWTGEAEPANA